MLFHLGGAALIFGIVVMVWPGKTAIIWGIYALIVAGFMARWTGDAEPAV
ncbi:MAG: hypothetical protein Q4D96_13845 [Propionibacteriaceae bacterium]|nr:hypothetical protein [Propionibacteriaceae bacterium]